MCPKLWYQLLVISAQVGPDTWVPVCFAYLPNKKKETYVAVFNSLKKYLISQGPRKWPVAASFAMCDWELALRDALTEVFGGVDIKGCHFHYAKALFQKVVKSGLKSYYSRSKKCLLNPKKKDKKGEAFSIFIRASIGMAYLPVKKLDKGFEILEELALDLRGKKIKEFGQKFLIYYKNTWLDGNYGRKSWNMFQHKGITSNNVSEGYNSKINNRKEIGIKPNPYVLASFLKDQLELSDDNAVASDWGNANKRPKEPKFKRLLKTKQALMDNVDELHTDWKTYIIAMGSAAIDQDTRIHQKAHDFDPEEKDDDFEKGSTYNVPKKRLSSTANNSSFGIGLRKARARKNEKNNPKKVFQNSSYEQNLDVDLTLDAEIPIKPVKDSKKTSKNGPKNSKKTSKNNTKKNVQNASFVQNDLDFTLENRFKKTLNNKKKPVNDIPKKSSKKSAKLLSLDDGKKLQGQRLKDINFILSPSQPNTIGDGNCFIYSILDQLR